jgi:hypothetical protein
MLHQHLIPPTFTAVYVSAPLLYYLCDAVLQLMEGWFYALEEHTTAFMNPETKIERCQIWRMWGTME